ncbi:ArnT family glycosyltransferase [Nonlabens marinus]|uniref:Integral membrane protein n=1 Tax=Nonlabens marinus S1-08 TaxID=1454201 RepID=W8VNL8_9FLAO|nr:glycosyltransferase family 39 protein [Nonlabens marinus]BAO54539.1 integral membrane protein [Nonlabens marinus S1-08]
MRDLIEKHPYWTILILWGCVFLAHLGVLYPNIMEARNFITAREMLTEGNWILTTMDGLPRYEKPPLPTWLTAFSGALFGFKSLAGLRLPAAFITLVLLFVMYALSRKLTHNKTYALVTTLVLGTSFYIIFAGRNGTWDIFAHSFMLLGIYFLFQFFETSWQLYTNSLLAGLFIGLSFMSKGPVSHYALLLPFLIAYGVIYRFADFRKKWVPLALMILIITILSAWWGYYIYLFDADDATRIAEKESGRWIDYETKPFYYYWSFFTQSGIWTIPGFICLLYPYLKSRVSNLKAYQFVLLWTLASLLLLSIIPTKKSRYLLPVLIPLAMTIGFYMEYLFLYFKTTTRRWETWPVYFNYGLIATIGIAFPIGAFLYLGPQLEGHYVSYILTSIALVCVGVFLFIQLRKKNFAKVFYGTISFILFTVALGFPLANALLGNPEYETFSELKKSSLPILTLDNLTPELVWEYGEITKHTSMSELRQQQQLDSIMVLTTFEKDKTRLDSLRSDYSVEWKGTVDLNPLDSTRSSYKDRLKSDYYLLSRN